MFEQMLGPGLGAGLIDAVLAQPDMVRLWLGWLAFISVAAALPFLPRLEAFAAILAFGAAATIMAYLFETHGFSPILGLAHFAAWPPLLLWLWARWYGIDSVVMRLWILLLAASCIAAIGVGGFQAAMHFIG
jgi:hypothetical protein